MIQMIYWRNSFIVFIMQTIRLPFDTSRNVSGPLALLIVMGLACLAAWFSLSLGRQIIDGAEHSPMADINQRSIDLDRTKR